MTEGYISDNVVLCALDLLVLEVGRVAQPSTM
jgi:hypothetical protein